MRSVIRKAAATFATAGVLVAPMVFAQPAHAGVVPCTLANVNIEEIRVAGFVNCTLDGIGMCTFYYDPLFPPFPNNVVPATENYVVCLILQ